MNEPITATAAWDVLGHRAAASYEAAAHRAQQQHSSKEKKNRHMRVRGPVSSLRSCSTFHFMASVRLRRISTLKLSKTKDIVSSTTASICSLDLDKQKERFLLSGASNGSISLHDVEGDIQLGSRSHRAGANNMAVPLGVMATRPRASKRDFARLKGMSGHRSSVNSACWYPVDNGLIMTGGSDHQVVVWSAANLTPAASFDMEHIVNQVAMSPTRQHCLLAVATQHSSVRLCDPMSGAFSHVLAGHTQQVLATQWSPLSPHILATGASDKTVRFWDIRRSGGSACLSSLDMHEQSASARAVGRFGLEEPAWMRAGQAGEPSRKRSRVGGPQAGASLSIVHAHSSPVAALQFAADGKFLLTCGSQDAMRLWRADPTRDHEYTNTFTVFDESCTSVQVPVPLAVSRTEATSPFDTVAFHVNNTCGNDVLVSNVFSGKLVQRLRGHYQRVTSIAYRSSDQELYTGGEDGMILAWEPQGGQLRKSHVNPQLAAQRSRTSGLATSQLASRARQNEEQEDSDQDEWSD